MPDNPAIERKGAKLLATIRPGPVLHIWQDGCEVVAMPLTTPAALRLASDILKAVAIR